MGAAEVESFLSHLAVDSHVSASTQNQALQALLFLYQRVLEIDLRQFALRQWLALDGGASASRQGSCTAAE